MMQSFVKRAMSLCLLFTLVIVSLMTTPRPVQAAVIGVTTTADENGNNLADCSLREAIIAANTNAPFGGCTAGSGTVDQIKLPANTYVLTIGGINEDGGRTGDLDITEGIQILGAGPTKSKIFGGPSLGDRIFHVNSTSMVTISGLSITDGNASVYEVSRLGGGILNDYNSLLTITNVELFRNSAGVSDGSGGGLANQTGGKVYINTSVFNANTASYGGGIYNLGSMQIKTSLFTGNQGNSVGGAIDHLAGFMTVTNSTIAHNTTGASEGLGSGIATSASINLKHVTIAKNNNASAIHLSGTATLSFQNTIIVVNQMGNCNIVGAPVMNTLGYNIEDANTCRLTGTSDMINEPRPVLEENLSANGGPTRTFKLAVDSPAADVVPISRCEPSDQRLFGRRAPACDVGAYEEGGSTLKAYLPIAFR